MNAYAISFRQIFRHVFAIACLALALFAVVMAWLVAINPDQSDASSHREAPLISEDPAVDNLDVYAFVSPDVTNTVTLIATWIPFEEPGGGPNPWGSQIPEDQRATAIAAFNSGFKMDQARGGVYFGGQEVRGLVGGAADRYLGGYLTAGYSF